MYMNPFSEIREVSWRRMQMASWHRQNYPKISQRSMCVIEPRHRDTEAHMLSDVGGFIVSLIALQLSQTPGMSVLTALTCIFCNIQDPTGSTDTSLDGISFSVYAEFPWRKSQDLSFML